MFAGVAAEQRQQGCCVGAVAASRLSYKASVYFGLTPKATCCRYFVAEAAQQKLKFHDYRFIRPALGWGDEKVERR